MTEDRMEPAEVRGGPRRGSQRLVAASQQPASQQPASQPHCDVSLEQSLVRLRQHLVDAGKEHLLPATRVPGWEARNGDWWPPGEPIRIRSIKKVMAFLERRYRPPSSEGAAAKGEAPAELSSWKSCLIPSACPSLPWTM